MTRAWCYGGRRVPPPPEKLSDRVHALLWGPVDSFEKLEVVLALHGAQGASLTLEMLVVRAPLTREQVERAVAELVTARVVERTATDAWRVNDGAAAAIEELARAWDAARPTVLKAMTDRALGNIRASAARAFADAFRWRKRGENGDDDG
jgi:hypothetical protein